MSDAVVVALIAAVPSTLTLLITAAGIYHVWHVPVKLNELVEHTNGLTDKLIEQKAISSHAEGVQSEKNRTLDANAAIILAAAQIAADKILAAAKLAKEG